MGGHPGTLTNTEHRFVDAAAYNPDTGTWHRIASLPVAGQADNQLFTVWAAGRLVVADEPTPTSSPGRASTVPPVEFFTYNPATNRWQALPQQAAQPTGITQLLAAGNNVIAPTAERWCGGASCPPAPPQAGEVVNVRSHRWQPMPTGPVDDNQGVTAWTGTDLVHTANVAFSGATAAKTIRPGDTAAWDAQTKKWTRLPPAPERPGSNTTMVWTGHKLILWGDLIDPTDNTVTDGGLALRPIAH